MSKTQLAKELGVSRSLIYYKSKIDQKDKAVVNQIKKIMSDNPCYGHRRIAIALGINRKRILRIMNKFGLKPELMRTKSKYNHSKYIVAENLIRKVCPIAPNIIWVTDFTYMRFKHKFIFLATVLDVYTREIIGWNLSFEQNQNLTIPAIKQAFKQGCPEILHSDRGAQYQNKNFKKLLADKGVMHSQSDKSSPWQNSWQESFYSQFKLELGGTGRFQSAEDLIEVISRQIEYYNNERIHTSLKKSPKQFLNEYYSKIEGVVSLSEKMGT